MYINEEHKIYLNEKMFILERWGEEEKGPWYVLLEGKRNGRRVNEKNNKKPQEKKKRKEKKRKNHFQNAFFPD